MARATFGDRLMHAWNAFQATDDRYNKTAPSTFDYGLSSTVRQDRKRLSPSNERSIVASIYTRIAVDVAAISLDHVRVDQNGNFVELMDSGLNYCLHQEANLDQTGREFILDLVVSMLDEGVAAAVPVETNLDPRETSGFKIEKLRTGRITQWYPKHVKVEIYNEDLGRKQEIRMPKSMVAIVQNPFYEVMNEPNSTLKRLTHKLNLLDAVDEQASASKLDMIIQLPYAVKSEARLEQANKRRKQLEEQLTDSKYGIGYIDSTEHITQLNRSLENNLMGEIEYLTSMLYSQLGMPADVFSGTADEKTMLNYYNRTIEPILSAIADEMQRKFITKTGRTQMQAIKFYRDPFRLVPVTELASIADTFTRNEVLSTNEVRSAIGYRPIDDARADELRNKNLNLPDGYYEEGPVTTNPDETAESQNGDEEIPEEIDAEVTDASENPFASFDPNHDYSQYFE